MIRVVHPGSASRIRILFFSSIPGPDPGVKKEPDPGSGSATPPRVPECLSHRRNQVPPLSPHAIVSPPLDPEGGASLSYGVREWGDQFGLMDRKAWHSVHIFCSSDQIVSKRGISHDVFVLNLLLIFGGLQSCRFMYRNFLFRLWCLKSTVNSL